MTLFAEDLHLARAKVRDFYDCYRTEPHVAPGSYNIANDDKHAKNNSIAPFCSTSERFAPETRNSVLVSVGKYEVRDNSNPQNVSSCPFRSTTDRFAYTLNESPGPGRYHIENVLPSKRSACAHFFPRTPRFTVSATRDGSSVSDPAHYYVPTHTTLPHRPKPRSTNFMLGPERAANKPNGIPGPGSYELNRPPKNLYTHKPSSMFVSKERVVLDTKEPCPGPGYYNIPVGFRCHPPEEIFSAFGTNTTRFDAHGDNESPAPGSYTREFVTRRSMPTPRNRAGGYGSAAFTSTVDRFSDSVSITPGPGTYNHRGKMASHSIFRANVPFRSTTSRFAPTLAAAAVSGNDHAADNDDLRQAAPLRFPGRIVSVHHSIPAHRSQESAAHNLSYNVNYDWPKPHTSVKSDFSRAQRGCPILPSAFASSLPGPGAYHKSRYTLDAMSTRHSNSSWGKAIRNCQEQTSNVGGPPGPGCYYNGSSLLKPTHNATIASDTTWLQSL